MSDEKSDRRNPQSFSYVLKEGSKRLLIEDFAG
jgi:hypothetical protein